MLGLGLAKAETIYTSPVSGETGMGGSYASGIWYHQIYQNTGQSYSLDQFSLHVNVGASGSTHNLTGSYGLDVYASNSGGIGGLLGSFTASNISSQFTYGSSAFRTFTFDLAPGAVVIPTQNSVFLLFKTTDTAATYTHASGVNAAPGWWIQGQLFLDPNLYSVGSTLGSVSASPVPEPSALSLLVLGLGGVMALRRRSRE